MELIEILKAQGIAVEASDINFLAKTWEEVASRVEYVPSVFCSRLLHSLCYTYVRGKGIKLGNYKNFQRYQLPMATLAVAVVQRVVNDDAKGIWFPSLVRLGFTSLESARKITANSASLLEEELKESKE